MRIIHRLVLVAVLAATCVLPATAQSQSKGWLTFTRWGQKELRVGVARTDGTQVKNFDTVKCYDSAMSPDAREIAYVRMIRDEGTVIEVRSVDGGEARKVCDVKGIAFGPCWSPDRKRLAFYALDDPERKRGPWLYVVNVDGSGLRHVGKESECFPRWSPDGKRLAYALFDEPSHHAGVGVVDVERGTEELLFKSDVPVLGVAWSPDGKRIAFTQVKDKTSSLLYTISAGGGKPELLTPSELPLCGLDYSDDGKTLYGTCFSPDGKTAGIRSFKSGSTGWMVSPVLQGGDDEMIVSSGAALMLFWRMPARPGPGTSRPQGPVEARPQVRQGPGISPPQDPPER